MLSGFGVFALGRGDPTVRDALHQALDADLPNLAQLDCALLPGLLAKALVDRAHAGIERVFFTNSGAEAIEAAVKFARAATGRTRLLYCDHAFHGLTNGALSLNGGDEFRERFEPLLPHTTQVPFGDAAALARELEIGDVAAFVVEPIQGKGVNLAPASYWQEVQRLCRSRNALLVLDEVQTGLGRTGRFFCHERYGIEPDIITVSKALSGGFIPVGATLTTGEVFERVFSSMEQVVVHSSTFARNQLAMVAGLATLQVIDEGNLVARAEVMGQRFRHALAPLVERHGLFHEVRGEGLMLGLVFGEPPGRGRARFRMLERARPGLFSQLVVVPLFPRPGIRTPVAADNVNIVKLLPPLIIGDAEIARFVAALDDVLTDAAKGAGLLVEVGTSMARGSLRRRPAVAAAGADR